MSLTQGEPLPSIQTTKDIETTGPEWYTDYLESIAQAGTPYLSRTGEELVAGLSPTQSAAIAAAPERMGAYTAPMGASQEALTGLTDINLYDDYVKNLMSGYEQDVIDEMARQQQQNMQRYMLPTLKGAFVGSGGLGGQRYAGALGQMGADVSANLYGQQAALRHKAFQDAMQAGLQQAGIERGAASDLGQIGSLESQAAEREARTLMDLGGTERDVQQQRLLAPLATAGTVANLFSNLKVPSTVSEEAYGPIPGAYSTSPLAQIAGLGSLFASGSGGQSAVGGLTDFLGRVGGWIGGQFPSIDLGGGNSGSSSGGENAFDPNDPSGWGLTTD
jgi:hypothetical protein